MIPKYKDAWLEALRSGRYKQTIGLLRDSNGYCCLGVLCDLVKEEVGLRWRDDDNGNFTLVGRGVSEMGSLPTRVAKLVGLKLPRGDRTVIIPALEKKYLDNYTLSQLNDDGLSFKKIAKIIEEQL